jgi:glycosyltransferase involved in cell wall biosynthesis
MAAPAHVAIVVPAYNEGARLAASIDALRRFLSGQPWRWEVRVVDDGSTDDTAEIARAAGVGDERIVLQQEPHRGKGGAVRAGILAADAPYRFLCDADLSMPLRELPRFLPPILHGADVVIGSREGAGARRVGEPLVRHLAGRIFNRAVQQLLVPGIEDTQCGFKMFTARAVDEIFPRVSIEGWAFDLEVLAIARRRGLKVEPIPIEWHYGQRSHVRLVQDARGMLRDLLRIRARAARGAYD